MKHYHLTKKDVADIPTIKGTFSSYVCFIYFLASIPPGRDVLQMFYAKTHFVEGTILVQQRQLANIFKRKWRGMRQLTNDYLWSPGFLGCVKVG
jgi:hypothetical protein